MPRALVIKTGTMSGMVHCLSAVSEAKQHCPDIEFDWVAEERYVAIPLLSPAVNKVYRVGIDRARGRPWDLSSWDDFLRQISSVGDERYDFIIDAQGARHSALIAAKVKVGEGGRWGFGHGSSSSMLASLGLDHAVDVPYERHAVERQRRLFSEVFGYTLEERPLSGSMVAIGIMAKEFAEVCGRIGAAPHDSPNWVVFVVNSGRKTKTWSEHRWVALGKALRRRGLSPVIPAYGENDRRECLAIAKASEGRMLPTMGLRDLAGILQHAKAVVGVDTGLTHWAAGMGQNTVGLMTGSSTQRFHVDWARRGLTLAGDDIRPKSVLRALTEMGVLPKGEPLDGGDD
ncbi:RfaF ADP-heptose,LPS heptosyltransferase [Burkholderiales bacterium]